MHTAGQTSGALVPGSAARGVAPLSLLLSVAPRQVVALALHALKAEPLVVILGHFSVGAVGEKGVLR